ncbi:hypothetical protein [Sunxiuqinia sp. sy24]|uniref:hypothetical protein n=1 Tax=Sunxiuqinia sp. sy24 TaxID=3461495 RepID=UPI0040455A91
MKQIDLEYYPYRWLLIKRKVTGHFPQNWGDVQPKHLIALACLYKGTISELRFLEAMSSINQKVLKKLDEYQRYKLSELLEFVQNLRPRHELILRKIAVKDRTTNEQIVFHAPKAKLKGFSFGQFIFTDTYFSIFQQSQDPEDLARFVASLYWPRTKSFNDDAIQGHADILKQAKPETLEAIAINWQLIHEWLSLSYPLIFQKAEEEETTEDEKEATKPTGPDQNRWIKVFNNLVGDDILSRDQWAETPVNTIFEFMTRKYKENAKRK